MTGYPLTRAWTSSEHALLDRTPLIGLATEDADGALTRFVTIGHVRLGTNELVRSLNGTEGTWHQRAVRNRRGVIDVDGTRFRVVFTPASGQEREFDEGLRERYGDDSGTRRMTFPPARDATLLVLPAQP